MKGQVFNFMLAIYWLPNTIGSSNQGGWGGRGRAMDQTAVQHCQYRHYLGRENTVLQMPTNPWRRKLHRPENIQTHEKWLREVHGNRPGLPSPRNEKMPNLWWRNAPNGDYTTKGHLKRCPMHKKGHFLKFYCIFINKGKCPMSQKMPIFLKKRN